MKSYTVRVYFEIQDEILVDARNEDDAVVLAEEEFEYIYGVSPDAGNNFEIEVIDVNEYGDDE